MTESRYSGTVDWNEYWTGADTETRLEESPSAEYLVEPLGEFITEMGVPNAYADVGCGAGAAVFDVAERFPDTTVVGYDSAEAIIKQNRTAAAERNLGNVRFEQSLLPGFDPGQNFDLVTSFFTLCYVADVETALQNLYDAVAPGGYLVITYHNRYAQALFTEIASSPEVYLDGSSSWDPDRFPDRFALVLEGESLLSYDRIHEVLGTWPQSFWSVSENTERYGAWRQNPVVYIPK